MAYHHFNDDAQIRARAADIAANRMHSIFRPTARGIDQMLLAHMPLRATPAFDRLAQIRATLADLESEAMDCAAALATGGDR